MKPMTALSLLLAAALCTAAYAAPLEGADAASLLKDLRRQGSAPALPAAAAVSSAQDRCSCHQAESLWINNTRVHDAWNIQCIDPQTERVTYRTELNTYPNYRSCDFDARRWSGENVAIPEVRRAQGTCLCRWVRYPARRLTFNITQDGVSMTCSDDGGNVIYDTSSKFYPTAQSCQYDGNTWLLSR